MIATKQQLLEFLEADKIANNRKSIKIKKYNDEIWDFIVSMRMTDYKKTVLSNSKSRFQRYFNGHQFMKWHKKWHRLSVKLGITMGYGGIGKGFSIAHYGLLTINGGAKIGDFCRVHEGVCIGSSSGSNAPQIGNYVFIGTGAKIIGDIKIADYVQIGANAVVTKSILEPHTTWAGIPAKKISNRDSKDNLVYLFK